MASQSARAGGLAPPEIDLFLRPNCLLNIIDHQSCQGRGGRREKELYHKKGSFF